MRPPFTQTRPRSGSLAASRTPKPANRRTTSPSDDSDSTEAFEQKATKETEEEFFFVSFV
jgi:hypothetical protein